jgi:hypothetical protein
MNKPRVSLRCRLGLHPWDKDMTDEGGRQRCPKCGRFYSRSLYYGTWMLMVATIALVFVCVTKCSGN